MKIIDLLQRIANGEEVPKKVKYEEDIYIYDDEAREGKAYHTMIGKGRLYYLFEMVDYLNEEVEIIEEDKKIEKLDYVFDVQSPTYNESWLMTCIKANKDKINEILDYINKGDE